MQSRSALAAVIAVLSLTLSAAAADVNGMWRSTVSLNGQSLETIISFHLDSEGPMLTGFVLDNASNQQLQIYHTSLRANRIQFSVDHDSAGQKLTIHYQGDVSRDAISGTAIFEYGDRSQTGIWTAKRERVAGR